MEMTPLQIASEYRTGKDKSKTIKVLAELNLVTQRTIAQILDEQGEELPGHWKEKLAKGLKREPKERIATPALRHWFAMTAAKTSGRRGGTGRRRRRAGTR